MRPRLVIIGEVLFVTAIFVVGSFLVVDSWNKDVPSSNMSEGVTLITICILSGGIRTIWIWRKHRSRSKS